MTTTKTTTPRAVRSTASLDAVKQISAAGPSEPRTDEISEPEVAAFDLLARYDGPDAVERMRTELVGKSDAYRRTRLDGIVADEPRYRHRALIADLVAAANREEGARRHRYQAFRNDEKTGAALIPGVRWPKGFDRAKAIVVLEGAEFRPYGNRDSMFQSLAGATDSWLLGALERLLEEKSIKSGGEDQLIRAGYRFVDGRWQFGGGPLPPSHVPQQRADAEKEPLSWRDQWRRPPVPQRDTEAE